MTSESDGATASAPTDMVEVLSVRGVHVEPPFVVFQTPPATAPKSYVFGSPATSATASARPPRKGPIWRHFIAFREFSLSVCENAPTEKIMHTLRTRRHW